MTLCLNECLRAVGLQHHHDRFTSMGVCRAVDLSSITLEDYPILGIRTMEDRTRLFNLVQMIKALDLESLEYEDDEYGADGGDGVVGGSFTNDDRGDPDESDEEDDTVNSATSTTQSCVRRRLDFSSETVDCLQKQPPRPVGSVHACAVHPGNDAPVQVRRSDALQQPELHRSRVVACGKGGNDHRTNDRSRPSNTEEDATGGVSMYDSLTGLSPKSVSFHQQNHRPAPAAAKTPDRKTVGHKDRKRVLKKERLYTEIRSQGVTGHMVKPTPTYEWKRRAGYNYGLPLSSPSAPHKKQEGEQRISVCVRKRPLTRAESRRREADVVTTSSDECVVVHESKEAVDLTQYVLQHRFYFDQVFGENSSNQEVYQRTAFPLVQHMLNGGKATCFAYGQTGAGKTHTMLGSSTGRPGLYALAVRDIFSHLSTSDLHSPLQVYVSFFEIYCGQLYDLLDRRKRLFAREDGQGVVHIAGLRDVRVDSVNSLLEVISVGTEERTQGTSGVNPLSSRSHALLKIQLRRPNHQAAGRMWFVDLAGSERASDTKDPDRQSRMEGAEINQSLLALKECIRSLDQEQSHTPFRQSKLTQVLKDSFVGDSMTCMIANISPGHLAAEHTLNTLRYADRVKELRGQGRVRGGRRGKTTLSPKHNLSNSSSSSSSRGSFGLRGKSPPKKQKLGRRREAFVPASPNFRPSMGDTNLCSTPKDSRCNAMSRKGIGLEHLTPIWREEAGERNMRRLEHEKYGGANHQSGGDQNIRAGPDLEHPIDRRILRDGQNSLTQRENVTELGNENRDRREEGGWSQQEERRGDDVKKRSDGDVKKSDERETERRRHLRWYHQQLQQFTSSPASSDNLLSSLGSSVSSSASLQHDSQTSASARTHPALEDVLSVYGAEAKVRADADGGRLPFWSGDTEFSPSSDARDDGRWGATRDGGGLADEWRSAEITGGGRSDKRPAGMGGGERRRAWSVTELEDRVTGSMPTEAAARVSRDAEWSAATERGLCAFESARQRAQAERPFSPAGERVNTPLTLNTLSNRSLQSQPSRASVLHLPLQNPTVSSDATTSPALREFKATAQTSNKLSGGPLSSQSHPDVRAPTSALAHNDTDTDSLSHTMDPLSLSLLQVDQQVATTSFIQGEQSSPAFGAPENKSGEVTERFAEVEDEDVHFSFLKLPQANFLRISDTVTGISPTGRGKDTRGVGRIKPLLPEAEPIDQESSQRIQTVPVLGTKPSTCASMQPPATQSVSRSVHLPTPRNLIPDAATQSPTDSIHRESVLDQGHVVHSVPSNESNKGPAESGGGGSINTRQRGATTHLSTLKHLNHAQCHVVRAHLEQLEEMEALYHKEGTLLYQQPDMGFGEYVHKLEEIMERKARCVHSMRAQLQPYLTLSQSNPTHNQ